MDTSNHSRPDTAQAADTAADGSVADGAAATPSEARSFSRRSLMFGTGIGALAGLAGYAVGAVSPSRMFLGGGDSPADGGATGDSTTTDTTDGSHNAQLTDSTPTGATQAGVARPGTPQRSALFVVADLDLAELPGTLTALGDKILELVKNPDPTVLPDGAGDLTVLVGLGPRALASLPQGSALADTLDLPRFAGDEVLDPRFLGGDLLMVISASDRGIIEPAFEALRPHIAGYAPRWADSGYRGPGEDGIVRNPLGFHDGIIGPRGEKKLDENVWVPTGPLAGGTVCVLRRFVLDTARFHALDLAKQNAVFGREKVTGVPLSGGKLRDEGNIVAKTESGEFLIPTDSHLRAAHPSFTGSELMLRRSYGFASPPLDGSAPGTVENGLLFMSFQNDVRTFARTQQRMDEIDALMGFARPTATAAFAILPGFDAKRALGASLV